MSTALVPASSFDLVPQAASLADQIARTDFAPAGLRGKPEAVMAAMLTGHEIGIGPMQALSEISVINGRPCMSAKLMRALVHRAGHDLWFEVKSNTKVTICARRADWPEDRVAKVTWTMDDAKAAGLAGGQNYRKYPRAMLAARATGEICRDNFADVLGGIGYTPEELSDGDLVADDDLVVESRADVAPPEKATNVRKAKVAPARKTAAAKAAPAPAPEPPDVDLPPLPGEDGFDGIVDAEVVEDDPVDAAAIQARIDELTQEDRQDLGEWWKAQGIPPLKSGNVTAEQAAAIGAAIDAYNPATPDPAARNKKMWAMVAEAWPSDPDEDRDELRRHLIEVVSAQRTASSKDLTDDEWSALFDGLQSITDGSHALFLRSNGEWELRKATGGAS
ncbi:MAG: hypothetical protein IPG97_14915 [Microthrixaceae bacterium]|mgnify:CR=1 FL=1|nr:hypothetical protein [Microthrixaceae bacterium]